jgi:polysaccharide biosynthesis protein PslH
MRILFLSRWYPYPADNGSKIRVSGLLRALSERHEVTVISFVDPSEPREAPPSPGPACTHVCAYRDFAPRSRRALAGIFARTPRFLVDTHNPEMDALIRRAVRDTRFDLVIASQVSMAAYHEAFRGVPAVFEEVELGAYRPDGVARSSPLARLRRELTWAKHSRYVARLLESFACCTVASERERELLAAAAPRYPNVYIVPNAVEAGSLAAAARRDAHELIFTGSLRYGPNLDAMAWFVDQIFPAIRSEIPAAHLTITGDTGGVPLSQGEHVTLTGRVPNARPLLARSSVSVAPIRQGGGTRLKILEAMALRTPVVATTKAVEGIEVRDREHLLVADTPSDFASAVLRVLGHPSEAAAMADRAWRVFQARYEAGAIGSRFANLMESVHVGQGFSPAGTSRVSAAPGGQ